MTTVTVNTTAQLLAALKVATAGETIQLSAGTYAAIAIKSINVAGGVTITSASSATPATITGLTITGSSGLTFQNLNFSTDVSRQPKITASGSNIWPFRVTGSSGIDFNQVTVNGPANGTRATDTNGFLFTGATNCAFTNSTFNQVMAALQFATSNTITVSGNTETNVFQDGVDVISSQNVTISDNSFATLDADNGTLHSDAIEFWVVAGQAASSNVSITGNTYVRAGGSNTAHFLLFSNHIAGAAYDNVTISGNSLTGASYIGIEVEGGNGVVINGNTSVSYADKSAWIGARGSANVTITNNTAQQILNTGNTNVTLSGNILNKPIPVPAAAALASAMASLASGHSSASIGLSASHLTAPPLLLSPR